jgi:hypothetical protein
MRKIRDDKHLERDLFEEHITPLEEHCNNSKNTTFQEREKPLAGAVQSHQNKDTSPISWQFLKIDV